MKIFGSISELLNLVFRKNSQAITLRPNQATTYTAARDVQFPPGDTAQELVSTTSTQTLTNKTLTAPVVSTISNTGTLTLPTTTDTLVGRVTADQGANRLKNKDLESGTTAIVGAADTTKKIKFDPSGATGTATTLVAVQPVDITVTLPDISDTIVARTTTDTLTNKSISGATNTLSAIPNSATTATSSNTASAIVARDGSGNFTAGTMTGNITGTAGNVTGTVAIANGGTGQTTANAAFGALSPMTTNGDLITRVAGVPARLAAGVNGQVLSVVSGAPAWSDGGAGGSGEINVIDNPSMASSDLGWGASGAGITVARTTTSSDLPLSGPVDSAIKITPVSGTDYVDYLWTMPAALKNKKLKVEWYQRPLSGYASGDLKVEIYKNTDFDYTGTYTEFPLSTDVSGTSGIPNATGKYTTTFDSDGDDYYQIRITRVSGTTALNITNVIIGPGIQPQGAVVGAISYGQSLTLNNMPSTSVNNWTYQRIGDALKVQGTIQFSADGVSGSDVSFTLPYSLTTSTTRISLGTCEYYTTGDGRPAPLEGEGVSGDLGKVKLFSTGFVSGIIGTETGTSTGRIANIYIDALIPIAEWAGSGTVNLAQNDVEYASNSSATDANDSTSFVYGPSGSVGVIGVTTLTTTRTKRVRFQTPIQQTDSLILEFQDNANSGWVPVSSFRYGMIYTEQGTSSYGSGIQQVNTTDADVKFGQYAYANGASFNAAGVNWSGAVGTLSLKAWRVKKVSGGQAVGFGAATATSMGLVKGGTVPGKTDGVAVAAGYLGEVVSATPTAQTATGYNSATACASLSLTAGIWLVTACCSGSMGNRPTGSGAIGLGWDIYNSTAAAILVSQKYVAYYGNTTSDAESVYAPGALACTVNLTASATLQFRVRCDEAASGTGTPDTGSRAGGLFQAVRIG